MRNTFIILLLCSLASFAQEPIVKFGVAVSSEVKMKTFEADTSAEAVILYDKAKVRFTSERFSNAAFFQITEVRHQRIKILKSSALSRGIVKIPYYRSGSTSSTQVIRNINGFVFNDENGKIIETQLSRKDQTDEKGVDSYFVKQLSFPNVKVGSVIDIEYTIDTPFGVSIRPETWYFQHDIPTVWSEYSILIPGHFFYQMMMGGYLPLHINEQKEENASMGNAEFDTKGVAYRFVVKDVPAFKDEPYITTEDDYYSKIDFELSSYSLPTGESKSFTTTWDDLDNTLLKSESFGIQLNRNNFLKDEVDVFMKIKDPNERAKAIYQYMTKSYQWNDYTALGTSEGLKKTYTAKKGNAADINLLLVALLNECEINAHPIILSTRSNGRINTLYPTLNKFNYVIAGIENGEKYTFLDATDPNIVFGALPLRCLNQVGRVIKRKGKSDFVAIETPVNFSQMESVKAEFDVETGEFSGFYKISAGGYLGYNLRNHFKDATKEAIQKEIEKNSSELELTDFTVENLKNYESAFDISYKFKQEGVMNPGIIYLDPMMQAKIKENPFKSKNRAFPVDFGHKTMYIYTAEFKIPEGYEMEEKPEAAMIALPEKGGRFIYNISLDGNTIKVVSQVHLSKTIYYAEEYPFLKEFYNKIVQKHAQQIVLKEK